MSIDNLIASLEHEIITLRRELHKHPELGWKEVETSAAVESFLKKHGYAVSHLAETGLVADLAGTARQGDAHEMTST